MRLGVSPDRVVLANACKRPKDMRSAVALGVELTTFDTESELQKLALMFPNAAALLRIRADDPGARCILGNKYGAEPSQAATLLEVSTSSSPAERKGTSSSCDSCAFPLIPQIEPLYGTRCAKQYLTRGRWLAGRQTSGS